MSKRTWMWILVGFILLALAQEPTRFADAVEQTWNGLVDGGGSVMEGFFTFIERL